MRRSSRRRALVFTGLAVLCALASAGLAARYRGEVEEGYGTTRRVVLLQQDLPPGEPIAANALPELLVSREIPERFAPVDALAEPDQAVGAAPRGPVPAGSYLLASHLRAPGEDRRPRVGPDRRPVEVGVAAAGSLLAGTGPRGKVDVVAAEEPGLRASPRVVVLAKAVPLLDLRRTERGEDGWIATLALRRGEALAVIEAENFSAEVRLLPR